MNQEFQKPWQLTALRIHDMLEWTIAPLVRLFGKLNPNNSIFEERPKLRVVK